MFKKILYALLAVFVALQLYRPAKNQSNDQTHHVSTKYAMSDEVRNILKTSCNDCHSNNTVYPWYAEVQPVGIWLAQHVNEGKKHLNFSQFTTKRVAIQNHKFEEVIEMVDEGHMPLGSYLWIHRDAVLSDAQKNTLLTWAKTQMDSLRAQYPADSLVLKRK
jgi:hypothetical protein